jgi:hypothetical protein
VADLAMQVCWHMALLFAAEIPVMESMWHFFRPQEGLARQRLYSLRVSMVLLMF